MPGRQRNRLPRWRTGAAAGMAAVLVAVALVVAALWTSASSDPVGLSVSAITSAVPSPPPTVPQSVSATPTPIPLRNSPSPRSASEEWRTRLAAFSRAVTDQQRQGGISSRLADEIRQRIGKLAGESQEGKDKVARDELLGLGRDLVQAQQKGRLAPEGPLISFLRNSGFTFAPDDRRSDDHDNERHDNRRHGGEDHDDEDD